MAIKLKEALCQSYRALPVSSHMLFRDTQRYNKPHVHVYYGEYEASVGVDGELLAGSLSRRQL